MAFIFEFILVTVDDIAYSNLSPSSIFFISHAEQRNFAQNPKFLRNEFMEKP